MMTDTALREKLAKHFADRRVGGDALIPNEDDYAEADAILPLLSHITVTEAQVEAAAEAIYSGWSRPGQARWENLLSKKTYRDLAHAALEAARPTPAQPSTVTAAQIEAAGQAIRAELRPERKDAGPLYLDHDGHEYENLARVALEAAQPNTQGEPDLPNGHAPVDDLPSFLARRIRTVDDLAGRATPGDHEERMSVRKAQVLIEERDALARQVAAGAKQAQDALDIHDANRVG